MTASLAAIAVLASRGLITVVFGVAAAHKVRSVGRFVAVLGAYRILPAFLLRPVSLLLIAAEGFVALGVWFDGSRTVAVALALALLTSYAGAIGLNLKRGRRDIDCGCSFGGAGERLSPLLLVRNAALVLLAIPAVFPTRSPLEPATLASAFLVTLCLLFCYQLLSALRANQSAIASLEKS
ncbi:MauE/DoxX family redox-associated membrane protein [Pseudohaliea sp.]|uniref:MauE/DoxX family redox-associated membrane protein n=1 Tax=Pseudohaliea sp. TaxID=2740289 RepID=UPI0032EB8E49